MTVLFIEYPKCSTCQKARKWLENNQISFESRNIVEHNPTEEELKQWIALSQLSCQKFFNTSGLLYKTKGLKDKLPLMSDDERIHVLASNGMLIKRPLIIAKGFVLIGFKEDKWQNKLLQSIK